MCRKCLDDDKIETKTTFTVEYGDCIIVVRNVPCLECSLCGEQTFTEEVAAKLESVIAAAKLIVQDISVIDFSKVA